MTSTLLCLTAILTNSNHQHNGMEGTKFIANQAKSIYHYKSIRFKVLKCNADIFFNKKCLTKNIIPKYANIKVPATSKAAHTTQKKVSLIRIKD
jgi:hypothetical protein